MKVLLLAATALGLALSPVVAQTYQQGSQTTGAQQQQSAAPTMKGKVKKAAKTNKLKAAHKGNKMKAAKLKAANKGQKMKVASKGKKPKMAKANKGKLTAAKKAKAPATVGRSRSSNPPNPTAAAPGTAPAGGGTPGSTGASGGAGGEAGGR